MSTYSPELPLAVVVDPSMSWLGRAIVEMVETFSSAPVPPQTVPQLVELSQFLVARVRHPRQALCWWVLRTLLVVASQVTLY
jgi:hypothetical protein